MTRPAARLLCLLLAVAPAVVLAHPLAPALLDLHETTSGHYAAIWRTSVVKVAGADVAPQWPADCTATQTDAVLDPQLGAFEEHWQLDCPAGLSGQNLAVSGLDRSTINVILRITPHDGATFETLLDAKTPSISIPPPSAATPVFGHYLALGMDHLFGGVDHLCFIVGLLLLVRRLKPLLATVTSFTLGHSLTLGLATLGLLSVSPALAELGIAASIVVLASELLRPAYRPTVLGRHPGLMAGSFGLLHGLGFAGALAQVGLPDGEIPMALFGFNVGIEAAQLLIVAAFLALAALLRRWPAWQHWSQWRTVNLLVPAYLIGTMATYWCLQRGWALLP